MTVYSFGKDSPIDEITVIRTEGGGARALIHAREGTDPALLHNITRGMEKKDWQWTPMEVDGKPVLEVRGFGGKDNELLRTMDALGSFKGLYQTYTAPHELISNKEKFKKRTLQFSGFSYFVGDANFMIYGWKEAFNKLGKLVHPQDLLAGIFYAAGSWFVALFGKGDKSDVHLRDIARETLKTLNGKGIRVDQGAALQAVAETHNRGFGKRIKDFCEKYPAELTNGFFGLAGTMITWGSITKLRHYDNPPDYTDRGIFINEHGRPSKIAHNKTAIKMDIGLGLMSLFAGLVSIFVREERPDPDAPPKKGVARLWQKVKEKPLRIAGYALGISTLCHAASTVKDYRHAGQLLAQYKKDSSFLVPEEVEDAKKIQSGLINRGIFVGTNLLAEFLMSISSKGHGSGIKTDPSLDNSTHAVMADLLLRTPEEKRETLLADIAKSISHKDHLGGRPEEHAAAIRKQMDGLKNSPWLQSAASAPAEKAVQSVALPVAEAMPAVKEKTPQWSERISIPDSPALSPGSL